MRTDQKYLCCCLRNFYDVGVVQAAQEIRYFVFVFCLFQVLSRRFFRFFRLLRLECAAIIAYKQPITRTEIEILRGLNSDYAVNALLELKLIYPGGRKDAVGRPVREAGFRRLHRISFWVPQAIWWLPRPSRRVFRRSPRAERFFRTRIESPQLYSFFKEPDKDVGETKTVFSLEGLTLDGLVSAFSALMVQNRRVIDDRLKIFAVYHGINPHNARIGQPNIPIANCMTHPRISKLRINPISKRTNTLQIKLSMIRVGFGWAKPVPINPYNFRRYRVGLLKSAHRIYFACNRFHHPESIQRIQRQKIEWSGCLQLQ